LRKVLGINDGRKPRVPAFFCIKSLDIMKLVWFLLDTGSIFSILNESEALLMGIEPTTLPYAKVESIGFGGTFKHRMINRSVELIFKTSENDFYKIPQSGFRVCSPEDKDPEKRKRMVELTPCVVGMDVLSKFEIHIYKKKIELIPFEP